VIYKFKIFFLNQNYQLITNFKWLTTGTILIFIINQCCIVAIWVCVSV